MKNSVSSPLRRLMALYGLILFFYACSASDDSSPEMEGETLISAKIGSVDWEDTNYDASVIVVPGEGQRFDLQAFDEVHKIKLGISEFEPDDGTLSETTYDDPMHALLIFYYGMGNNTYISEHQSIEGFDSDPDISININSSTSELISGTFSGTFYKVGDATGMDTPEIVVISDGIFNNVPFQLLDIPQE